MTCWNERYRKFSLDEIKGQDIPIKQLKELSRRIRTGEDGDMPHLLLVGMQGIGKTASSIAFLYDTFGENYVKDCFLERNASDTARVEDLRGKIREFASGKGIESYYVGKTRKTVPFRTIFLDEVDYLPATSQAILRRMLEDYSGTCRFIFSCNYENKLIEPLVDRCMLMKYKPLKPHDIKSMLQIVIEKENININTKALHMIGILSRGSARKAHSILQSANLLSNNIDEETVYQASYTLSDQIVEKLIRLAQNGQKVDDEIDKLFWEHGLTHGEILNKVYRTICDSKDLEFKKKLLPKIGNALLSASLSTQPDLSLKCFFQEVIG